MIRLLLILAVVLAVVAWRHRPRTWAAYNTPTYAGGSW